MSNISTERKLFIINGTALKKATFIYRALYHPLRLKLIEMIHKTPCLNVTAIIRKTKLEQSLVSAHLKILREAKLLLTKKEGRQVFYTVNNSEINRIYTLTGRLVLFRQENRQKRKPVKKKHAGEASLSTGEKKVIHLVCEEYTSEEIAKKLGLSKRTVEEYRSSILKKTKARNSVGILIYALKNELFRI